MDNYPLPPVDPLVEVTAAGCAPLVGDYAERRRDRRTAAPVGVRRRVEGQSVFAQTPDHRLDIGEGIIGVADLMEEIARIYGYDRYPRDAHGG